MQHCFQPEELVAIFLKIDFSCPPKLFSSELLPFHGPFPFCIWSSKRRLEVSWYTVSGSKGDDP